MFSCRMVKWDGGRTRRWRPFSLGSPSFRRRYGSSPSSPTQKLFRFSAMSFMRTLPRRCVCEKSFLSSIKVAGERDLCKVENARAERRQASCGAIDDSDIRKSETDQCCNGARERRAAEIERNGELRISIHHRRNGPKLV